MHSTYLSSIEGNFQWLDGGAMFGNAPKALWEGWQRPDTSNRIRLSCRALLIEAAGKKILCEAGIGICLEPKLSERYGVEDSKTHHLLQSLGRLGLDHSDIDYVILSHLHFDHAGGILPSYEEIQKGNGNLLFPKAMFLVGVEAFERASAPHRRDKASFLPSLSEKLEASGRLILVKGDKMPSLFGEKLRFIYSSGHTPGQMHVVYTGEKETVFFAGDLIPGTSWVHLPVTMGYDRYPELLIDEKQSIYDLALEQKWILFFTHDPVYSGATITRDASGKIGIGKTFGSMKKMKI